MPFALHDKVALITGAGSGIGRAIAIKLAEHHALVQVLDINEAAALQVAAEINSKNFTAAGYTCNVSSQAEMKSVTQKIMDKHSRVDILINSAGIAHVGKLENTVEADFDKLFTVNVKGVYNAMQAVIPFMKEQKSGTILNLASVAAWVGLSDRFAYSMTKGAVAAMTLSVAKDYVQDGIRCNSISPGRVHTPFVDGFLKANYPGKEKEMFDKLSKTQPIGRMATPEEIANLALFLCSDEAAFITGTDYPIDGGFLTLNT
ncbi:MAG TPA: glucose 1-dehydrogenase [Cyclobacteriaceae bacterium]|jgi:2-keto-3-deoxy-L-fuconate dehydrogenase|nr:glucose 1-dehydrogenase [Cytophagales bacterium]HNT50269.1 glucose 1-dehydrogenase [Cyclobacteriaceae bacterium]HRE66897.1 glucose 1-dehydrogenase [Cyclobacteriaceae bacterium]HRF34234.1 glucose 1-dehydrogenase [Cyclobacteriaceae bacterium]